jgi:hypothetical protein
MLFWPSSHDAVLKSDGYSVARKINISALGISPASEARSWNLTWEPIRTYEQEARRSHVYTPRRDNGWRPSEWDEKAVESNPALLLRLISRNSQLWARTQTHFFIIRKQLLGTMRNQDRKYGHCPQITITKSPSRLLSGSSARTARSMVASFPFLCTASPSK